MTTTSIYTVSAKTDLLLILTATLLVLLQPCRAVYLTVADYSCSGDLTIESLDIQCGRGDCDFGTSSIKLVGSVTVENDLTEPVYTTVAAYINGIISSSLFKDDIYPCNSLTADSSYGYYCPEAGLYNFTVYYQPPDSGSSVWWSSGQIKLTATFLDAAESYSQCQVTLQPTNIYGSFRSSSSESVQWMAGVASVSAIGLLAYFGKQRTCITRRRDGEPSDDQYGDDTDEEGCYESQTSFEMMDDPSAMSSLDSLDSSGSEYS